MGSKRGNSSASSSQTTQAKILTKENAAFIVDCISSCLDRAREMMFKIQSCNSSVFSAVYGSTNSRAEIVGLVHQKNQEIQFDVSLILRSLGRSIEMINDIMGTQYPTLPLPGAPPMKRAAITSPIIPQTTSSQAAVPWPVPRTNFQYPFQQGLRNVPNIQNVASAPSMATSSSSGKKTLEALYGPNNELPEKLKHIEPGLIQQIMSDILDQNQSIVKWDDIAGLEHAKKSVNETVLWPVLNPKIFQGVCSPSKGVLLFGPPGTGKTMIGKAIAGEMKATFFNISATTLTCKWLGDGEKLVRALFGIAKHFQPSVIFLDEIDCILFKRSSNAEHEAFRRLKTQFLVEMEGVDSGSEQIVVVGATNRPHDLDEAVLRQLSKRLYVPLPSAEARLHIVRSTIEKAGKDLLPEKELDEICRLSDGYSGSDMRNLVKEAMMGPVRDAIKEAKNGKDIAKLDPEDLRPLGLQDFENALKEVRPSVCQQTLAFYADWNARYGSISI